MELSKLLHINGDLLVGIESEHNITHVEIPNTVHKIRAWAFDNDKTIETIVIPSSVEEIGWGAFYQCAALKKIYIPRSVKIICEHAFSECNPELEIYLEGEPQEGWFVGDIEKKIVEERIITDEDNAFNFHRSSGGWSYTTVEREVEINHHWNPDNLKVHCNVSKEEFLRILNDK